MQRGGLSEELSQAIIDLSHRDMKLLESIQKRL